MNKVLLVLSFVALSLSVAWASSIQDDDLIDFELVVLTRDGESWIGASGAKIKYADSKAISSWRRDQERGGNRTTRAAVKAIGKSVESGPDGVVKLRVPDGRLSIACELDGLVTFEIFSAREVRVGRAEVQLQNGSLEMAHRDLMESIAQGSRSTLAVQFVDEAGEPIRYKRADFLVFVVMPTEESELGGDEAPPFAFYSESYDGYFTDKEGRVEFLFGFTEGQGLEQEIDGGLEGMRNRVVVHLKAGEPMDNFSRSLWSGETLTGVATLEGPHSGKRFDLGRVSLTRPPLLISGRISDQTGSSLAGVGVFIGDVELASGSAWTTPISFHFTWDGMSPDSDPDAGTEFDYLYRTRGDGSFEIRGRLFQDEWGLVPASAQGEVLLVAIPSVRSSRGYASVELTSALGSKDVQVAMGLLPQLKGNVLLPDAFPPQAILIHARKPGGALAGGAMSLDARGVIQMHSAPRIMMGDPRRWSSTTYGGITYDESSPAEIEPGTWDVCFELKGERDWSDPDPFLVIPAVNFSKEGVTEDPRLKDIDLREVLYVSVLVVQDSEGELVQDALVRCKPANSGREWLILTEGGLCRIATTAKEVDVEIMYAGHRPKSMKIALDHTEVTPQLVSLEKGVPVTFSITEGLEVPAFADALGERPTRLQIRFEDARYTGNARSGLDESPYGRRHPDRGFGGEEINYIGTSAGGGGMVIDKLTALELSGRISTSSISSTRREITTLIPEAGRYEVVWMLRWEGKTVYDTPTSSTTKIHRPRIATGEVDIQEGELPTSVELKISQEELDARLGKIRRKE